MCLISWERTRKRDPHKLFRGDFGGQNRGPKRAIFGHKKFSFLFFFLPLLQPGRPPESERNRRKGARNGVEVFPQKTSLKLKAFLDPLAIVTKSISDRVNSQRIVSSNLGGRTIAEMNSKRLSLAIHFCFLTGTRERPGPLITRLEICGNEFGNVRPVSDRVKFVGIVQKVFSERRRQ